MPVRANWPGSALALDMFGGTGGAPVAAIELRTDRRPRAPDGDGGAVVVAHAQPGLAVFDESDDRVDQLAGTGAQQAFFGVVDELGNAVAGPRDDRNSGCSGLQCGDAEGFAYRRVEED